MITGPIVNASSESVLATITLGLADLLPSNSARSRMDSVRSALRGPNKFLEDAMENENDPELGLQWNWCPIEGCSPVIHGGRLFVKHSRSSQFRYATLVPANGSIRSTDRTIPHRAYYTVLTQGYLVTFKLEHGAFHMRRNRYSLLEAYVSLALTDASII